MVSGADKPRDDKRARLAAALRENLKRRKAQARAGTAAAEEPAEVPVAEGAEEPKPTEEA